MKNKYPWIVIGVKTGELAHCQRKKPIRRVGKKTREWDKARRELKIVFERNGVTECELGYPGCWGDSTLGYAHSLPRREINTPELLKEALLACVLCHQKLDLKQHDETARIVREIIAKRGWKV